VEADSVAEKLSQRLKMSTVVSLEEFAITVEKLNLSGANWVMFQSRFIAAVRQMGVYEHLDGSHPRPSLVNEDVASSTEKKAYADELAVWDRKENLALYMLSMKLLDLVFAKYMCTLSVATMWAALVKEFVQKSVRMRLTLHSEFMNMHYEKGADLREQFNLVRNAGNQVFAGIAGAKGIDVMPAPVLLWLLAMKNVLWERVDHILKILMRAKGMHLAVPILALAPRGRGRD
jgi:hypothetical protein